VEAENAAQKMYGDEQLMQAVKNVDPKMKAKGILWDILQGVIDFVGNAEQRDDMTIVVVKKL
jgi:serine phosphatase RsbU (regulator of sigma subunit)